MLFTTYNFLQSLVTIHNCSQLLQPTSYHFKYSQTTFQLLTTAPNYLQLLSNTHNYLQLLTSNNNCSQSLTTTFNY